MGFDRTDYQCPLCGKWCCGAIAFRKHYAACKEKSNKKKVEK